MVVMQQHKRCIIMVQLVTRDLLNDMKKKLFDKYKGNYTHDMIVKMGLELLKEKERI